MKEKENNIILSMFNIDIKGNLAAFINLKQIFGIGKSTANKICYIFKINPLEKAKNIDLQIWMDIKNFLEKKDNILEYQEFQKSLYLGNDLKEILNKNLRNLPSSSVRLSELKKGLSLSGNSHTNGATARRLKIGVK